MIKQRLLSVLLFLTWCLLKVGQLPGLYLKLLIYIFWTSWNPEPTVTSKKIKTSPVVKQVNQVLDQPIKIKLDVPTIDWLKVYKKSVVYLTLPFRVIGETVTSGFGFVTKRIVKATKSLSLNFQNLPKRISPSVVKKTKVKATPKLEPVVIISTEQPKRYPKVVRWLAMSMIVIVFLTGYSYLLLSWAYSIPTPRNLSHLENPSTTEFYDRNGKLLYRLYEGRNRTKVKLDELPPYVVNATIAIEDQRFFQHPGVDIVGISRAVWVLAHDKEVQGGSTITQQLIKNTLLTNERTWQRKIKEMFLALWTETVFDKNQILEMYFNESPYGGPAWGIEAAAQTYFNKAAKDLSLAEASYLAGLPNSPTAYSPYGSTPELGIQRQKEVLRRMMEEGYITAEQMDKASQESLVFAQPHIAIKAPHFVMWLRSVLAEKYGEKAVSQGGLRVYTTLDLDVQEMAEEVLNDELAKIGYLNVTNGAVMVMDPKNGQILAMVGSKNYFDPKIGNFNVAIAPRQPGSSIKPITFATGFKQGYSPGTVMLDTPFTYRNQWENYSPVNYDGKFHGPVSVRTSLGSSYNIPAVKMLALVGIPNMVQTAKDMGITTFEDSSRFGLSLTLGGGEVKLIDMMTVYGTFAQNGMKATSTGIVKVVDQKGTILEDSSENIATRALNPAVAYLINSVLSDNAARTPSFGPNSLLNIPGQTVAVKTGTTDLKRDNWTFGYTQDLVVGVWVGNNDNTPMDPRLSSGITGAAPIWNRIMTNLLQGKQNKPFERPSNVVNIVVDGNKDLGISGISQKAAVSWTKESPTSSPKVREITTITDPYNQIGTQPQRNQPIN